MNPSTNSGEIEAAAAAWFAKRESGVWSSADQARLESWLDSSTAHRIAFLRIATAWERAARLSALGAGVPAGSIPSRGSWGFTPYSTSPPAGAAQERLDSVANPELDVAPSIASLRDERTQLPPRLSVRVRSIAAALVTAAAIGVVWYFSTEHARSYRTQVGALATVTLAEGSKITLNTDTEIEVELNSSERRIKLERGEAFFAVSKDAARPFVVEVADKSVTAVGTQFSVRRYDGEMRVLVTEGRVQIEHQGLASKTERTQLAAGSEARTAHAAVIIDQPAPIQIEELLGWRSGHLIFRDTALADAVADFNRYSIQKIVIEDPTIAGIRIGGNFRSSDVDAFLWLLQSGFPIIVDRRGDQIVLTKRQ
jgi:transmembrane sensor